MKANNVLKRVRLFFVISLLIYIALSARFSSGANSSDQKSWYDSGFIGLVHVIQAGGGDTDLGAGLSKEHIGRELRRVNPDFVMYDSKGHPGYSIYPSEIGYPSPGIKKDGLRLWRDVTRDMGIRLIVQYSGLWDEAAIAHHPDWAAVNPGGKPYGQFICLNSDYLHMLVIPQMMEIIDKYDVDGFWIDGDCWAALPCWCERCRRLFTQKSGIREAPADPGKPGWNDWLSFHRNGFFEYVRAYTDAVHKQKPGCLVCSNWLYSTRTPDEPSIPVDYVSGDVPSWDSIERIDLEGRYLDGSRMPWDIISWTFYSSDREAWTMKPIEHLKLEASLVLSAGGKLSLFNLPERNGHIVGWQQDILAETARYARERQSLVVGSKSVPQVAVLHSAHHYYSGNAPLFNPGISALPLEGALRALLENHYHVDILNEEKLTERIDEYNLVVIPEQRNLPETFIARVKWYIENGGRLLVSGVSAIHDFGDIAGVENIGEPKEGMFYFPVNGGLVAYKGILQPVRSLRSTVIKKLYTGPEIETNMIDLPVATIGDYGKGRISIIPAQVFEYFVTHRYPAMREFFGDVMRGIAPDQIVEIDAPPSVTIAVRSKNNALIINLVNRSSISAPTGYDGNVSERIVPAEQLAVRIRYPRRPESVRLIPGGTGLSWEWEDGILRAVVERLDIHSAIVIE